MDKVSVLGDAIKYLKQLQEKVKTLEEQSMKKSMESVVFVKKTQLFAENGNSSSDEDSPTGHFNDPLPEIEARFSDKNVLIRVHCEKRKGVFEKTVAEIEKLHLTVINSSVMTFATSALDITIIAQVSEKLTLTFTQRFYFFFFLGLNLVSNCISQCLTDGCGIQNECERSGEESTLNFPKFHVKFPLEKFVFFC